MKHRRTIKLIRPRSGPSMVLHFVSLLLLIVLLLDILPTVYAAENELAMTETADYGIYDRMVEFQSEKATRMNNPDILAQTKEPLDDMTPTMYHPPNPVAGFEVREASPVDPRGIRPFVFNELEGNSMMNLTELLHWILPQPLTEEGLANFWVFTRSEEDDEVHTAWEQGSFRRTLVYPRTSLTKWIPINTDDNTATGPAGADVRLRFNWVVERATVQPPTLIPPSGPTLEIKGGIELEIERLRSEPFQCNITIVKGTSYNDNNYIWTATLSYDEMPQNFTAYIGVDKIQTGDLTMTVINSFLNGGNLSLEDVASIKGPYRVEYVSGNNLDYMAITAGILRLVNEEIIDKTWMRAELFPAEGLNNIPRAGDIWINAEDPNAPLDTLEWHAGSTSIPSARRPVHLRFHYSEEAENLTYAKADIKDLPTFVNVTINYETDEFGRNITILDYIASDPISEFIYDEYLYFREDGEYVLEKFNYTHFTIQDIPRAFHVEVTTDVGRDVTVDRPQNPASGLIEPIVDSVIRRVAGRIYSIGVSIRAIPMSLLNLPSNQGRTFITCYDSYFGDIRYVQTSGRYLHSEMDYFAFFTDDNIPALEANPRLPISLSGHFSFIKLVQSDMRGQTQAHLELQGGSPFYVISVHGSDYVNIEISNLPNVLDLRVGRNAFDFHTGNKVQQEDGRNQVKELSFTVKKGTSYLRLNIKDVPTNVSFAKSPTGTLNLDCPGGEIGTLEVYLSNDYRYGIPRIDGGNAVCLTQQQDYGAISARINSLQSLSYNPSSSYGVLDIVLAQTGPLALYMQDSIDELELKMILDPIPNHIDLELPGEVDPNVVRLPDTVNITGLLEYSDVLFSLSDISSDIIDIFGNVTRSLMDRLGGFGTDFSFSYDLMSFFSTMDVVISIKRGDWESLGPVGWTHGASIRADLSDDEAMTLNGNIYLQGLPQKAVVDLSMSPEVMNITLDLIDYSPDHPWLVFDIMGLQDQDTTVYLSGLEKNMNLSVSAYMYADLSVGGKMFGEAKINTEFYGGAPLELKELYVKIRKYSPIVSIRELYLPTIPSHLNVTFDVETDVIVEYQASKKIEYLFIKMTKFLNLHWSGVTGIFHDVPTEFSLEMMQDDEFSLMEPLPMQGLPEMDVMTNDDSFDMYISFDGIGVGQRGFYEILLRDVNDTHMHLVDGIYKIYGDGIGFLVVQARDLSIMNEYKINSMILLGEEIRGLELSAHMMFGIYPVFNIDKVDGKGLVINIDHSITYMGRTFNIRASILDIAYRNIAGVPVPTETPILTDTFSLDMERNSRHILIPAPLSTLIQSFFP